MIIRTDRRARFLIFLVLVAAALALVVAAWPAGKPARTPAKPAQASAATPASAPASTQPTTAVAAAGGYFVTARLDQQQAQSRELALDQQVESDASATASTRAAAAARIVALGRREDQEAEIRALLLAKGYTDALVYLNGQPASAVVVLQASKLAEDDVLRAVDAVRRVAGVPAADISVMSHR